MSVALRHHCENPECPGFEVLPGERFCPWCGASQTRLELRLEARREGAWGALEEPPRLMHGERPEIRVVVRQEGRLSELRLGPGCFSSTVPWLVVADPPADVVLREGEEHRFGLSRFKPPREGGRDRATIRLSADGHEAEVTLDIVPVPEFTLEPTRAEARLERVLDVRIPVVLTLQRGLTTLLEPPRIHPPQARLEWSGGIEFPLALDAEGRRALHGEIMIPAAEAYELRDRVLISLTLSCTGREETPPRLDLEVRVLAHPELVVEPFSQERFDWSVVRGITEGDLLELVLANGADARSDRTPLEVARLEILPPGGALRIRGGAEVFPCTLARGEKRQVWLGLEPGLEAGREHLFTLAFHTNEPRPRHLYLAVQVREPQVFAGWLAVDLGTTSTCAALVDDSLRVEMVDLEKRGEEQGLRSVVLYRRLEESRLFEVGYHSWQVYLEHPRSAVLASKRKAGDPDYRFEVIPVEEPAVKVGLRPAEVLEDLYSRVAERSASFLARSGGSGSRMWESDQLLPTRLILSHPSRFTQRQVAELKEAATRALAGHLRRLRPDLAVSEVHLVQEPIAAALSFLQEPESHAPWHERAGEDRVSWRLLVYDCGGGTTDLTLLEVRSSRRALASAPEGDLGPEDEDTAVQDLASLSEWPFLIADSLSGEVAARAEQAIAAREAGARFPWGGSDDPDASANRMMVENFATSAAELVSAAVLATRDAAAWERLVGSTRLANRLSLRAVRDGESLDVLVKTREFFPDLEATRRRVLNLARERGLLRRVRKGGFRYRVNVRVLGASGHPRFGGEEMTEAVRRLLRERALAAARRRYPGDTVELPDDPARVPFHQQEFARRNRALLMMWAEHVKIALAEGKAGSQAAPPPGEVRRLELLRNGVMERAGLEDLLQSEWPTREETEALLEEGLRQTVEIARTLVGRSQPADPEVLLLTGRASRWPQVERLLAQAFPGSRRQRPSELKECVVRGAALLHGGGPQAPDQPGVILMPPENVELSTCRLGIVMSRGGEGWFHEAVADGLPIPPEGLVGEVRVSFRSTGPNRIVLMENAGREDRMVLPDGSRNADVREVFQYSFEIPEHLDDWLDGTLTLRLFPDLRVEAALHLEGPEGPPGSAGPTGLIPMEPVGPGWLGRGY